MVSTARSWKCLGALALMSGCGGDPFVFSQGSADGSVAPLDGGDASVDAAPRSDTINCPNMPCRGQTCCTSATDVNSSNCTGGACGCSSTQMGCANEANCGGNTPLCCIGVQIDGCSSGHLVAQCLRACTGTDSRLCDPNAAHCPGGQMCMNDAMDLANVGLPSGGSFGVCK